MPLCAQQAPPPLSSACFDQQFPQRLCPTSSALAHRPSVWSYWSHGICVNMASLMTLLCFIRDISNYFPCEWFSLLLLLLPQMSFAIFKWENEFLIIITSQSTSICWTGSMISRSRLWSNFLHWRTNQLLSFHKFPQKIASCCSHSYPQGWRTVIVSLDIRYIRLRCKSSNTECVQTQYISDLLLRKDDPDPPSIWWASSAALPFQGVAHLPVQVFRTSTARVIRKTTP